MTDFSEEGVGEFGSGHMQFAFYGDAGSADGAFHVFG